MCCAEPTPKLHKQIAHKSRLNASHPTTLGNG